MLQPGTGSDRQPSTRGRSGSQRNEHGTWGDEGFSQAIEAMLIGVLVFGAIGFTLATQAPPPPSQTQGVDDLEEKTWAAVQALDKMAYPDVAYGNSQLSYLLAQAAAGDPDVLKESLAPFMPPGSEFQIFLHNGFDRNALYSNKTPQGQTVGISYPIEPGWLDHYGRTDLNVYNANLSDVAMGHTLVPIFNSNHVHDQGEHVKATAKGELAWRAGFGFELPTEDIPTDPLGGYDVGTAFDSLEADTRFEETAYTTLIQGAQDKTYPSAAIYMHCERGDQGHVPCYGTDLTQNGMDGYGPKSQMIDGDGNILRSQIGFVIENDGPGPLPAKTQLHITLPTGLELVDGLESPDGSFDQASFQTQGANGQPTHITASLNEALQEGEDALLDAWVARTDDRYAYKHVHATLSEGAASSSQFLIVVQDKQESVYTGGDTRVAMVSTPRPAGSMDDGDAPHGRWAIVLPTPVGETTIEAMTLETLEGQQRFLDAAFPPDFAPTHYDPDPTEGTLQVDPDRVTWTQDDQTSQAYEFLEIQFNVTTDGTPFPASPTFPTATPTTQFQGYHPPPHFIQANPGMWWTEHPPDEGALGELPGYGLDAGTPEPTDPVKTATIPNTLQHRNHELPGTTTYRMADFADTSFEGGGNLDAQLRGAIRDAVHASSMETEPQRVAPGDTVQITIDSRDLALFLSQTVGLQDLSMETQIYAPWGIAERKPAQTYDHNLSVSPFHDPITMLPASLTGSGEDLLVASMDGNVYGIEGDTGSVITGKTFPVPGALEKGETGYPSVLTEHDQAGAPVYGVGTSSGLDKWYSIDEDLDERWSAQKPEGRVPTTALDARDDLTGDGINDFVAATKVDDFRHRLVTYDGATGDIVPGWENASLPVYVQADQVKDVGFANVSTDAVDGVWAAAASTSPGQFTPRGLFAFLEDGTREWTFWGGPFEGVDRTDAIDVGTSPDGTSYHGLVGANQNGWIYGFNSSKAMPETTGRSFGTNPNLDVAFSNPLEGYLLQTPANMLTTHDGGTSFETKQNVSEAAALNAVDTPDGAPFTGQGNVSWWAGELGAMYRSTDRLSTVEALSSTASLTGGSLFDDGDIAELLDADVIDLSDVRFHDVHAVSEDEALFVGQGLEDSSLEMSGLVVHTRDGGSSFQAHEFACADGDLLPCGLNAIEQGERFWAVGDSGLAVVQDLENHAWNVSVDGSTLQENGVLALGLDASSPAPIKEISVDFTFDQGLEEDWLRGIFVDDGVAVHDLWNKTQGEDHLEDGEHSDKGASAGSTLLVDSYTSAVTEDEQARVMEDSTSLMLGPFRTDTKPEALDEDAYFEGPDYDEDLLPVTFTVGITYDDGSWNRFEAYVDEDGNVTVTDETPLQWVAPDEAGFQTPACFGEPGAGCTGYTGLDVLDDATEGLTIAATSDEASMIRLPPGGDTFETVSDDRLAGHALNDVSISPEDPHNWVVVGDGIFYARSYDAGEHWTVLPPAIMLGEDLEGEAPLRAVDQGASLPMIVGGHATDLRWWIGGHPDHGYTETKDLWEGPDGAALEKLSFDASQLHISESWGADVEIFVHDPDLDDGEDGWARVYEPNEGWDPYAFSEPAEELKLRFELSTDSVWSPRSPQVRGQLSIDAILETSGDPVQIHLDLNDTQRFQHDLARSVEHSDEAGFLRLEALQNPWVWRLGNYDWGPWHTSDSATHGAQPTAMELGPDGRYLFVGTGPIHGGTIESATNPTDFDNSLYKIDLATGTLASDWAMHRFLDPIEEISIGEEAIYVSTKPWTGAEGPKVYLYDQSGFRQAGPIEIDGPLDKLQLDALDAGIGHNAFEDLAALVVPTGPSDGRIVAFNGSSLDIAWWDNPSVEGYFQISYDVPRSAMFGAHLVVTEIDWSVTDNYGNDLVQSSRIHNSVDVTLPNGEISLSPTYSLEVVAWMEDWR